MSLSDGNSSVFPGVDPSATFSETLPSSNFKDVTSEEVCTEESIVGIAKSLPVSFSQDSGPFSKMQRLSNLPCTPARIDGSVQELQDRIQNDKEESHSDSETGKIQPHQENMGPVVTLGTQEVQSIALDYNPDSETKVDVGSQELTDGNVLQQSQIHCTVSSPPAPPSSVAFTAQDPTNYGVVVQSDRETIVLQSIHKTASDTAKPRGSFKDSNASACLLSAENAENKQTNLSKTQPKTVREIPNDDSNAQKENSSESVEAFKHAKVVVVTSVKETQPHSPEILETPKAKESHHGLYSSLGNKSSVPTSNPPVIEQGDGRVKEAQTDAAAPSVLPEFSPKPSAGAPLFDTDLVVSLHAGEVIKTDMSHTSDPVPAHEASLIAEIVHSANSQEIVVVREGAHISGDWSNMHLNQSYLLQREDGTVCEAAIVNELATGGAKLYEDSVQAGMELDSQPVEVYEFCGLVEEVAEETICGSSGTQIPQSPGYEVNLFNALLENTDEYIKQDIEPSIHLADERETIIISQQPLPSSSEHDSHNLSVQKAVGPHLILDNQTVQMSHSGEVCLVQVAAVASESFTVQQADTSTQFGTHCVQANATESDLKEAHGLDSLKPKAEMVTSSLGVSSPVVGISGENTRAQSSVAVSVHMSCLENQPCVSAHEGTKETPALTPLQSIHAVVVPIETKPERLSTTHYSSVNPKLLVQESAETPLLKRPNEDTMLTNSHGSWSGTEGYLSADVTKDSSSPSVAPSSQKDQTQPSEDEKSAAPVESQPSRVSGSTPLQTKSDSATASSNKPEALTSTKTSTNKADPTSENVETPTDTTPLVLLDTIHILAAPEESECEVTMAASPSNPLTGIPDYDDDDSEDMEQDKPAGEMEVQESLSGQVSSQEEDSDEEADESEMTSSSSSHKVRQWISERVSANSSPVSSSTSSSFLGPSSSTDWTTPRQEKSSPLRGPHGKFVSPSSAGYTSSTSPTDQASSQRSRGERLTDMAELAKHEANIEHRTQALKREGFWSTKRLSRLTEPQRPKVQWDYLCEEMQWLSADFAQERRWKRGVARKVVRMVVRHHEDLRQKEEKAKRDEHAKIRKIASNIAKEIRSFWSNVEKVVQFKQQSRLEEKRKKALDLQLDFIVGQTEKYSDLLSKSLAPSRPPEIVVSPQKTDPPAIDEDDRDFEPPCEEEDDEETIEVEEQQEGNDAESHQREIELLKEEGMLPLDQLLSTLKLPPPQVSEEECSNASSSSEEEEEQARDEEEDGEFTANEEDAEDEEDTIAAQEKIEGNVDHAEELDDLNREGEMSIEELVEKYKGAYVSDFEAPSGSSSKASSNLEVSGDEEVETEEDESDVESNTSSSDSPGDSAEDEESDKEEMSNEEADDDEGMELLLKEGDGLSSSSSRPKKEISHIAATAESLQPKGYTLATTKVKTPIPFLLHGTLREYQHIGLDWLVTMYEKKLNGILADEMGLGKTIQTIALLAHLACEKVNWGPHLIIVPTSVMLNWEMELKRWCPGFKILTYFGSQKERKLKRQGWTKPNAFHVCITSYKLVLQDHQAFRRKSWRYLILDEAQNIKNFKSQRWQSLLNFNSHRRLLLTGTPLQNSLMELWSLMHFLMPHVFQSHREFKEWFSNPLTGMIEGSQEYNEGLVKRLHKVLRPFLLRRIKADVEKQMPKKYEHVVRCRLSKRQRFLYDDFMAQASTRETLASGHFMSVINILMQLRKVCNHPNLFDPRPIQSPFITQPIVFYTASMVQDALDVPPLKRCDLSMFNLIGLEGRVTRYQADVFLPRYKVSRQLIQEVTEAPAPPPRPKPVRMKVNRMFQPPPKGDNRPVLLMNKPVCSVPPGSQTPKPAVSEVTPVPAPAPAVQQVVCSVTPTPPPRPSVHPAPQTAVRSTTPKPMLTIRAPAAPCAAGVPAHPSPSPSNVLPQRVLLSPDMQARLPSGEVVSIAQLASLAGRPVSSCQGSKPVTFQLQGNKLTLSGAQIHQVPVASPRPVQGNVMHLVSSGTQHHLISQTAQLTVQTTSNTQSANTPSTTPPPNRLQQNATAQASSTMVSSQGVVKIVVRQPAGKEGVPVPTLAMSPSPRVAPLAPSHSHPQISAIPIRNTAPLQIAPRTPGPATAHYTIAPPRYPSSTPNHPQPPRPILKVVQPPSTSTEQPVLAPPTPSTTVPKSSAETKDKSSEVPSTTKTKPGVRPKVNPPPRRVPHPPPRSPFYVSWLDNTLKDQIKSRLDLISRVNDHHCGVNPVYGVEVLNFLTFLPGPHPSPAAFSSEGEWSRSGHSSCLFAQWQNKSNFWFQSLALKEGIRSIEERLELLSDKIDRFTFVIPPVEASQISMHCCHPPPSLHHNQEIFSSTLSACVAPLTRSLHRIQCNMRTQFPDLRLIQYDCGKLQTLHVLLRKLKSEGHRVLIFTQMTRMLDVLEQFLNYHGHIYLRLDGSTRVEQRQALMERFNADRRIFCFILSTRSGGVGVNLTGADTVVFYDSDWNPTMDAQAQDRCHRIGQTRDVHIYRLISERTVEENILKKANQKRMLGDMAIEGGNFTTAFFKQQTIRELFDVNDGEKKDAAVELSVPQSEEEEGVTKQSTTILEQALCRAEDEEDIVAASQAKAEQVAELAEFNENIPLDDGGEQEEVEELSKAEQEIAALVEQLTPIERYAMNFLEASLEDVCKEELKQAEEQVEAARKDLDQAKEEVLMLHPSSDEDNDFLPTQVSVEPSHQTPARRGRKPKDKTLTSTRTSGRLRGASPEMEPDSTNSRGVSEKLRRGRGSARDGVPAAHSQTDGHKSSSSTRQHDSSKSPSRDQHKSRAQPNRSHPSPVPSSTTSPPSGGKQQITAETESRSSKAGKEEEKERRMSESSLDSSCPADHLTKDDDGKEHSAVSPPYSRSPRKRQSADGEVLQGLVDDSPSAKVLRKLPGRLVTVVEEKEPRKRRRRGSDTGAGGSSEDVPVEENAAGLFDEPNKDDTPHSPDGKSKGADDKSPQSQSSSFQVHRQPVRGYPPYSLPHLSPDMPVLRNLPVRSRMAAQLGEQQHLGRGRGAGQPKKMEISPGKDSAVTSTESAPNSLVTPLKRKRGRPPKTPHALPEMDSRRTSPLQAASMNEEVDPPVSPKRKRGRPRKDSSATAEAGIEAQALVSKSDAEVEPRVPSETSLAVSISTSPTPQSTKASETKIDTASASVSAEAAAPPASPVSSIPSACTPGPTSAHVCSSIQSLQTSSAQVSFSVTCSTTFIAAAASLSPTSTISAPLSVTSTPVVSTAAAESDSACLSLPMSSPTAIRTSPQVTTAITTPETECVAATEILLTDTTPAVQDLKQDVSGSAIAVTSTSTTTQELSETSSNSNSQPSFIATPLKTSQADSSDSTPEVSQSETLNFCPPTPVKASTTPLTPPTPSDEDTAANVTAANIPSASPTQTEVSAEPEKSSIVSVSGPITSSASAAADEVTLTPLPVALEESRTPVCPIPSPTTERDAEITLSARTSTDDTLTPIAVAPSPGESPAVISIAPVTPVSAATVEATTAAKNNEVPPSSNSQSAAPNSPPEPNPASTGDSKEVLITADTKAPSAAASEDASVKEPPEPPQEECDPDTDTNMEVDRMPESQRAESSSETKHSESGKDKEAMKQTEKTTTHQKEEPQQQSVEDGKHQKDLNQKRSLSRQSSQESACSSSPSSGCSTSTLTRHAHHKRTYENRHPAKKRRTDVTSEGEAEDKKEEKNEEGNEKEAVSPRRRQSRSSSSSSDSDSSESRKRLTRSAKLRLQDEEKEKSQKSSKTVKPTQNLDRAASNANTSTGGESSSDSSSVRITRKSAVSLPVQENKAQTNLKSLLPPEPEVLGKRCSALNAAAKLLAMKGRVDTPGHTTRKDPGAKAAATPIAALSEKKPVPASSPSNSGSHNKSTGSKPSTPNQTSHPPSRSTRRCPGDLVPPLEMEYKRPKTEEKDGVGKKALRGKEGEGERPSSSRGNSACSSMSSDGEGGGRSSRSRSSSNSSQRTHSVSSQNTERRSSRSRAASSGSDRDRSSERAKSRDRKERYGQKRESRSQKVPQELTSSSGTEGTPDRVLRSVAALAAVQARSPAASTRSSSGQQRSNKT